MLKIIAAPNPILSQSARLVLRVDERILGLIKEMKKTLLSAKDPEGVGLAAPQVGKLLSLFIAKPKPKSSIQVFINPKVIANEKHLTTNRLEVSGKKLGVSSQKLEVRSQKSKVSKLEGCLSLQNIWGEVKRNPQITASYLDGRENSHTKVFKGFMATIIQHETDHLNGILFPKRVLEQNGKLYKSKKNEKGEDIFEEIEV